MADTTGLTVAIPETQEPVLLGIVSALWPERCKATVSVSAGNPAGFCRSDPQSRQARQQGMEPPAVRIEVFGGGERLRLADRTPFAST